MVWTFMKRRHWVGKCMDYEVEGVRLRGRPKKTWREVEKTLSDSITKQGGRCGP